MCRFCMLVNQLAVYSIVSGTLVEKAASSSYYVLVESGLRVMKALEIADVDATEEAFNNSSKASC